MDTTNSSETPQRRVEDRKPEEVIDWAAPGAPAVPLSPAATSGTDDFMVYGRAGNRRADLEAKLRDALAADTATASGDELADFERAWPGIHKHGFDGGWRGVALAAWQARAAVSAATKPTTDLSTLTRHGPDTTYGFMEQRDNGAYVLFADVQSLLATKPAAAPQKDTPESMANSNARFAIDGAIQYGRENRNQPPSTDHWLYEYWNIGRQLNEAGRTGWDNVTPMAATPAASTTGAAQTAEQVPSQSWKEIGPLPVQRDENGWWTHPAIPNFDEDYDSFLAWVKAVGLETTWRSLESYPEHPLWKAWFEEGETNASSWEPEDPAGEGWFTFSIHDNEDGPVWVWARRRTPAARPTPTHSSEAGDA